MISTFSYDRCDIHSGGRTAVTSQRAISLAATGDTISSDLVREIVDPMRSDNIRLHGRDHPATQPTNDTQTGVRERER